MILSSETYHSVEANKLYFSHSQYIDFVGSTGFPGCEAMAMAKINGEWNEEPSQAMLVGSFVDAHFEGKMAVFKAQNPAIFKRDGDLRAVYTQAQEIIATGELDPYFMQFMSGRKQVVLSAEFFGVKWKAKIDSLIDGKAIVDLKVMKAIRDRLWVPDLGRVSFVEYWGHDIQGAIYQKVVEISTGEKLPFFIAALSKEYYPDHEIIGFRQEDLDDTMSMIESNVGRIKDLKEGKADPVHCGVCPFCRSTKVLNHPVHFSELINKV